MSWQSATVVAARAETARARTLVLDVPGWAGSDAGQHVDVRLTAENGYSTVRSYSIASATQRDRLELTVEEIGDGEVSPYLVETASIGDRLEVRGPIGGWFVWRPSQLEPIQLIGGGSGIVPLMAMIRNRSAAASRAPFRLLYSMREPAAVLYADELGRCVGNDAVRVTYVYTRAVPSGWPEPPRRIDADKMNDVTWPARALPTCYVCGPSAFVETVADLLIGAGHAAERIKTERFGATGMLR